MSQARFNESYGTNPAENYERFFVPAIGEPLARALINQVELRPSDRVLDVACGTGIVARVLSERIGTDARLAGLDANPAMLAVARSVTPSTISIEWHQAAAEEMPLRSGSFDVVICQMGLQFMPNKALALAETHRVLDEQGRVVVGLPGPISGVFASLVSVIGRHVGRQAAGFVGQVFALHDSDELEGLLRGAGFIDVTVEATSHALQLPPPREFLWQYIHSTPLAGVVAQASEDTRVALEQDALEEWSKLTRGDALEHQVRFVVASGLKA